MESQHSSQREENQRKLKNSANQRARTAEKKLGRRDAQIARAKDPDAKPGNLSELPFHQQKQVEGYILDVEKMNESGKHTKHYCNEEHGLLTVLQVRKRGSPAPVELWDLGFRLMGRGLSAGMQCMYIMYIYVYIYMCVMW